MILLLHMYIVSIIRRKCRCLIDIVQYNNRLRKRTLMILPASCPHSVVVTMGNCRHNIKVLDIPWAGGGSVA